MGGTGLEPVTPAWRFAGSRSRPYAPIRVTRRAQPGRSESGLSEVSLGAPWRTRAGPGTLVIVARYCVGPAMATDWDEETPARIDRHLISRAFGYFLPYWRRGLLSLLAIAAGAVLALAPALIAKKLIDHLSAHNATFSYVALLVGASLAAAIVNGIVNVGGSYLSTSIKHGSMAH